MEGEECIGCLENYFRIDEICPRCGREHVQMFRPAQLQNCVHDINKILNTEKYCRGDENCIGCEERYITPNNCYRCGREIYLLYKTTKLYNEKFNFYK